MASLAEIRAKYPQYDDMSDQQLADAFHAKFYSDMPRAEFDAKIGMANQRIAGAFEDAARQPVIKRGSILPISSMDGDVRFDSDAGILGAAKRGFMLPGQVYSGQVQLTGPDGSITPEAVDRVSELAAMAPAGMAARMVRSRPPLRQPASQVARQNVDAAKEFGIDISRGQASRDVPMQAFEQDALTGGRGNAAQAAIGDQRAKQVEQVRAAAEAMQDRAYRPPDGDVGFIGQSSDRIYGAAENAGRAVADEAARRKQVAQASFKNAETIGGTISPEATGTLSASMRSILDEAGAMDGVNVGADLPAVSRIMKQIDALSKFENAPEGATAVSWQNVERIRKQITAQSTGSDNQSRVFGAMKRGLDDWLEKTIDEGLVSGSPEFLNSLKSARGQWADYMRIKKNPQQIIRKMAEGSANSVEIANWVYGANKVGGKAQSANVVGEIKKLIGAESPAFKDLQRNVLTRLFDDVRKSDVKTYGKLAGDINDFVNGKGRELARTLYSDEQIKELNRFATVLRTLTPDDLATNPSRSGQTIARRFNEIADKLGGLLGFATTGSLSGLVAGLAVGKVSNMRSGARARAYARQPVTQPKMGATPSPTNVIARGLAAQAPSQSGQLEIEVPIRRAPQAY
jgi:hypothetical protein